MNNMRGMILSVDPTFLITFIVMKTNATHVARQMNVKMMYIV